ncbi:MAG: DUF4249 domain-containing protein [Cytophagales bacterium]|nr:DUF4249 domain-containing protein [Cytophagales bacterium]
MKPIYLFLLFLALTSCEEIVNLPSPVSDHYLVVEANLTNQNTAQQIILSRSQDYFDQSAAPKLGGALVTVSDTLGHQFNFVEKVAQSGIYVWEPTAQQPTIGKVGTTFTLNVKWQNETLTSRATLNRVPPIDSILYQYDEAFGRQSANNNPKNGYDAQFYARDFRGAGDCYRVKTYRNGVLFNDPINLTLVYDAGFQKGAMTDGLMFILPIRRAISPRLYLENDKIRVELWSISEDEFNFYSQARLELNNAGLFSRPAANIPTNIKNTNPASKLQGTGWFGVSAVSSFETVVDPKKARTGLK